MASVTPTGTINVSRALWDDAAFKDGPFSEREAWVWMLAQARYKAGERRIGNVVVPLERGELAASIRFLGERWLWDKSAVHRFLTRLEKRDMIRLETETGLTIITLCNYDKYQSGGEEGETPLRRIVRQRRDSTETAPRQVRDKVESRGKKGERLEQESPSSSSLPDPAREAPEAAQRDGDDDADSGKVIQLPVKAAPPPPPPPQPDPHPLSPRERVLEAMGLDGSGMGHDQKLRGRPFEVEILNKWLAEPDLTIEDVVNVVRDAMKKARGIPGSFKYFEGPVLEFLAEKRRPLVVPDAAQKPQGAPYRAAQAEGPTETRAQRFARRAAYAASLEAEEAARKAQA